MAKPPEDIPGLLDAAQRGDRFASEELLPLVYDHLRELARRKLNRERPGLTLQPTALVHEAYLRLVGDGVSWENRRHFFAAAANAMRRILVERARRRHAKKHGGGRHALPLDAVMEVIGKAAPDEPDWQALDAALVAFEAEDPTLAQVVNLRYFAGLSVDQCAQALGRSPRSIDRDWKVARAWLLDRLGWQDHTSNGDPEPAPQPGVKKSK